MTDSYGLNCNAKHQYIILYMSCGVYIARCANSGSKNTVITCNSTQGDKIHTRNVITLSCLTANHGLQSCSDANTRNSLKGIVFIAINKQQTNRKIKLY
jgi:hypothetical protein